MKFILIDLFCGAGGTTTGVEKAKHFGRKVAKVISCVNHDATAIASHFANHKNVLHFIEDIRTFDLTSILNLLDKYRLKYPDWKICIWASLECTNFSNAKGGKTRDADSRTLAEHLHRYIKVLNPDYLFIENVVEFMSWGPLNENGKPVSRDKGKDYIKWVNDICTGLGSSKTKIYNYDYRIMNSADYGSYTSRKRYFGVFAKAGLPISFPEATHCKNPNKQETLFGANLKRWKAVKDVLDFSDEGNSIFNRKKDLSPKSIERIYAGLIKYVAGGKDNFIMKYYSGRPDGKVISTDSPAGTITCIDGQAIIKASFLAKYHGTGKNILGVNETCSTITTKDRLAILQAQFWLDKQFTTGGSNHQSINRPAGTIMTNDKHRLVKCIPFISSNHYNNIGSNVKDPFPTITANRKYHYIINPSWFGNNGDINKPCCTIIARQDKSPVYLITALEGEYNMPVYDTDCPGTIKIKEFMALYGIIDIKMRMLKVSELLKIQGFPDGYILKGTQQQQKKFIGNSVEPRMAKLLIKANYVKLLEQLQIKKAA